MCAGLATAGNEVMLATTDADCDVSYTAGAATIFKGVPTMFFPSQFGKSFKYSRPFKQWLDTNVQRFDIVHIHAVFNHACIAAAKACRTKQVPYVVRPLGSLGPWGMKQKSLRKKIFWHFAANRMLKGAAAVHYTSEGEKQAVENSLHLNHGVVVPLGIDANSSMQTRDEVDLRFPALKDHPYVLFLSRLVPNKNPHLLIDAFLSVVEQPQFQSWRLVLAGDGPASYVEPLKQQVGARLAADFVSFTGWVEGTTKEALLQHASLLALPSDHENFGLCVMESLACGVPVLVSPQVNLSAEIAKAEAGWISEVDKTSLQQILLDAMGSKTEILRRGSNGRRLAQEFSWGSVANRLSSVYGQLCGEEPVLTSSLSDSP